MARPPKEINWDVVERCVEAGCNGVEIAAKFRVNSDTFYRRFQQEYGIYFQGYQVHTQEAGAADLRRMIHAKALDNKAPGNASVLMFLASRRLGMKEPETVHMLAANQEQIDQSHLIMQLQHRIAELEAKNAMSGVNEELLGPADAD